MTPDFTGAPGPAKVWSRCGREAAGPPPAAATPGIPLAAADEALFTQIRSGVVASLRQLQLCGLDNRCLTRDPEEVERAAARQRQRFFGKAWFGEGLRAYTFHPTKKTWVLGGLERRRSRQFLLAYFRFLTDATEFTDFLTRLTAGGSEFNLALPEVLELPALSDEDLFHGALLLAALEEDGNAVDEIAAQIVRADAGGLGRVGVQTRDGAGPIGLYVVDFREFIELTLLWQELFLYLLVPASLRRASRVTMVQATAATYGFAALASVPLLSLYHNTHGSAVVEDLMTGLETTLAAARPLADELVDVLHPFLGPAVAETLRSLWRGLLDLRARNNCELIAEAVRAGKGRIKIGPTLVPARPVTIEFTDASGAVQRLPVTPDIRFSGGTGNDEIYWMDAALWRQIAAALLLANQAGVFTIVTAASNRWGGKHPPHSTHRSGKEIDLDWGFFDPGASAERVVPNLQRLQRKDYPRDDPRGAFYDPRKDRTFDFVPTGAAAPATQTGFDALASWVVMQALPFAGFNRFLYSDSANMRDCLAHLLLAFPAMSVPLVWPQAEVSAPRPPVDAEALVEPAGHFNHLHAEGTGPPPFDDELSPVRIGAEVLRELLRLARLRDEDPQFKARFFPFDPGTSHPNAALWAAWRQRGLDGRPALLPVWVSET